MLTGLVDLTQAPQSELHRLKQLIAKSTQYYDTKLRSGRASGSDVDTDEWQDATGNRYLRLDEGNYSHFAPSSTHLIPGFTSTKINHKREWETYHRQALNRAKNGRSSTDLDDALIINAFGDHFLTDAFAAGHLSTPPAARRSRTPRYSRASGIGFRGRRRSSVTIIKNLVKKYTNPLEPELSDSAAQLLQANLDDLLEVLLKRKKLKKA